MTEQITRELSGKLQGYSLMVEEGASTYYGPRFKIIIPEFARKFDEGVYMDSAALDSLTQVGKQLLEDLKKAKEVKAKAVEECSFKQAHPGSPVFILDVAYGIDRDGEVKVMHTDSDGFGSDYSFANAEMLLTFCSSSIRACRLLSQMIEDSKDDE